MTTKICRICLRTNETLRKLEDRLADHFEDVCDYASGMTTYMCCSVCEDSLRNNLDFRNKCRKSNQILQEWLKSKNKTSIHLLHQLVQTSPNNIDIKQESKSDHELINDTKEQSTDDKHEVITELDKVNEISNKDEEIKKEIKAEVVTDENKAIIQEDKVISDPYPYYVVFHEENVAKDTIDDSDWSSDEVVNEPVKTKIEIQKEITNDNVELEDDIESASSKKREAKKRTRKIKHKKQEQPDSIKYAKYESVFDMKWFESEQEARSEVAQRRVSEPYVSARHRCEVCHTVYKSDGLLRYHLKWHDLPSGEFECDICRMRFPSRRTMTDHKHRSHRGRFACKMCPLITYQISVLNAHSQKHQGKVYKCHCERVFKHISTYMSHKRISHPSAHVCGLCARTFLSELGLLHHRTKMHKKLRYSARTFLSELGLLHHRTKMHKVHSSSHKRVSHVCGLCARTFLSELGLIHHSTKMHKTKSRVDEGTARCEPCGLTFTDQRVYTVHVMNTDRHKDIADTLIACSTCGLRFEAPEHLKQHRRMHKPKSVPSTKPPGTFQCKLCGASGETRSWLYHHHRREHLSEYYEVDDTGRRLRKHLCEQCGRSFVSLKMLADHAHTHTGARPHRCDQCPKTFSTMSLLKYHSQWHGPPKRECSHCGKMYHSASALSNHMRMHIGDRRYKCHMCAAAFLHNVLLREHVRGVHMRVRRARKPRRTAPAQDSP